MIYCLELVMYSGCEFITDRLETSFFWLKERGFQLTVEVNVQEPFNRLQVTLCGPIRSGVFHDEDIIYIFKHQLAEILSEAILGYWEKKLIKRQTERNYKWLSLEEQAELKERANYFLRRCRMKV